MSNPCQNPSRFLRRQKTAQRQGRDVLDTLITLLKAEWAGKNVGLSSDAFPHNTS